MFIISTCADTGRTVHSLDWERILARVKRSETRPEESCDEPVDPPIIQDNAGWGDFILRQKFVFIKISVDLNVV